VGEIGEGEATRVCSSVFEDDEDDAPGPIIIITVAV
jgi:hypothetical protein